MVVQNSKPTMGRLKTRDPTSRDHQNCGEWHRETGQRGTISQGWTSRGLLQCSSRCSLQSILCLFLVLSVFSYCYVRQTKLAISLDKIWAHYKIVWLTDRSISKSFPCHHCIVLYTVYVFYVRAAPVRSQHVAPRCTLCNSRPRLLPRLPLPIPTPLKLACSRLRPRCCCCCCCCRPAAVGTPYERRQNGWLHAETAGDYKRRCRIVTNRI